MKMCHFWDCVICVDKWKDKKRCLFIPIFIAKMNAQYCRHMTQLGRGAVGIVNMEGRIVQEKGLWRNPVHTFTYCFLTSSWVASANVFNMREQAVNGSRWIEKWSDGGRLKNRNLKIMKVNNTHSFCTKHPSTHTQICAFPWIHFQSLWASLSSW